MPMSILRKGSLAATLLVVVALAACARGPDDDPGALGAIGAAGQAAAGTTQDFVVNVGDRVFFETDSTELTPQSRVTLDRQAQWLVQYPQFQITVEGHADERGTREYNIALGARRSTTVRDYLTARGVASNRIRTISFGKERPVAVCDDISCWSQNRRAVSVLGG